MILVNFFFLCIWGTTTYLDSIVDHSVKYESFVSPPKKVCYVVKFAQGPKVNHVIQVDF